MQKYKYPWLVYLFGIFHFSLVRPDTYVGQDFSEMTFIFWYIFYCLFPYYYFIIFMQLIFMLHVTLLLCVNFVSIAWC